MSRKGGNPDIARLRPETPNMRHGAWAYKATGKIPEQFRHVQEEVDTLKAGLLSDEGISTADPTDVVTKRLALIDSACRMYVMARLLYDHVMRTGVVVKGRGGKEVLNDAIKSIVSFENGLRLQLSALGLERRTRPVESLDQYIAKNYPAQESQDDTPGAGSEQKYDDFSQDRSRQGPV